MLTDVQALRNPLAHVGPSTRRSYGIRLTSKGARVRTEGARARASTNNPELKRDSDCERTKKGPGLLNGQSADTSLELGLTLSYDKENLEHGHNLDGATAPLLLTESSQHPPPSRVDQVSPGTWASSRGGGRS
ncbi:hypothetical protein BD311DRAFT_766618, partial [Dichomitus squalens]